MYQISNLTGQIYKDGGLIIQDSFNTSYQLYLIETNGGIDNIERIPYTELELIESNKPIVPETITRRQLRKQLVIDGFDLSVIESMITDPLTLIDWQDSTIFERKNENVIAIVTALQIDLNAFFINASLL